MAADVSPSGVPVSALARAAASVRRSPSAMAGWAALLVLIALATAMGPWMPFVDLVSFAGMDAYPPALSYGPFHYYTFQFTYIGHYALSRLMTDLHVSVSYQTLLLYLLQAVALYLVIWRSLERLVANAWWRACAIAFAPIAFWDGPFLWGGPLAYSLAATCLSIATFLTMREAAEPPQDSRTPVTLLIAAAILCHPFAAPFALILCGLRFLFVRRRRWHTVALALGIVVFSFVILRDSPPSEAGASGRLSMLFGVSWVQLRVRCYEFLNIDRLFAQALFGPLPLAPQVFFVLLTALHCVAFLLSPVIAWKAREAVWLRMLATLNTVAAVLFVFSWDVKASPIPEWPQRIMTLYAPFTYLGGVAGLGWVAGRFRARVQPRAATPWHLWLVPAGILLFVITVQASFFRFGGILAANYASVRAQLLKTDVHNAYVVVAGVDDIQPFYLRSLPFLLFSDRELIERHVMIATEWHFQDRHPSRLTEMTLDLNRKRYSAEFSMHESMVSVRLIEHPAGWFPIIARTNVERWGNAKAVAAREYARGETLLDAGVYASALEHFNTVTHLTPKSADGWNSGGAALFKAERVQDSIAYFEAALQQDPKLVAAHVNLALAFLATGRSAEALPHLEEAARLDPTQPTVRELLPKLRAAAPAAK